MMEREIAQIWTPAGHQDRELIAARKAAQEYDSDLDFGFNEKTQQYCVYLKAGSNDASGHGDLPILGFVPPNRIPAPLEIKKRLYLSDATRRGHEIIDEWDRQNELLKKKNDHSNADGQLAEAIEWGFRKKGSDKAPVRVFMPGETGEK